MLTPEDKQTLIQFAGPLFAMSKEIDKMYYEDSRPKIGGYTDSGIATGIQEALERDFRTYQALPPRPPAPVLPQVINYAPPEIQANSAHFQSQNFELEKNDNLQLEFNFNQNKQDIANDLLESQNKMLKELNNKIDLLISMLKNDDENKNKQT